MTEQRQCVRGHLMVDRRKQGDRMRLYCLQCRREKYGRVRKPPPTRAERFLSFIFKAPDGCWHWHGAKQTHGYGSFGVGNGKSCLAHRWSYEHHRGPIPEGMTLDHLCRVVYCVNPEHLEVVTRSENGRREAEARRMAGVSP